MISAFTTRRMALLATFASTLILAACGGGGGGGNGSTTVRALNLTTDLPSIDVFTGDTKRFSAVAADAVTTATSFEANTYTMNVKAAGDGATLLTGSYSLTKDANYTAVVWGRQTALRLTTLPEDESTSNITSSGNLRVRMFNATVDTGAVDVYLTTAAADLGESTPTQGAITSGALSGFREISANTYRLRVTGSGDPTDVRLDIPSVALGAQKYYTIVLTSGGGGVLVNGTLIEQRGPVTALKNTKARVRLVASVASNGNAAATFGATTVAASLRSPSVGPYVTVDAGTSSLTTRINGNVLATGTRTLAAGNDYTVLVSGSAAAGQQLVLADDNRLPTSSTKTKIRLVNGVALSDPMTLSIDYLAVSSDVVAGAASAYATVNSNAAAQVQVTTATAAEPLFQTTTTTPLALVGQGVYSVFMLAGNAAPTGIVRRER